MTTETTTAEPAQQTLAEYKAERLAGAQLVSPTTHIAPLKDDPKGEVVAEAKEVPDPKEDAKDEAKEEGKEPEGKKKPAIASRFSEITEQRRQAEQRAEREAKRAEDAERERDELKARLEPPKKAADEAPQPKPEDYGDAFKYAADLAEWTARKAVLEDREEQKAAAAKEKADAEAKKVTDAWKARLEAAKKELPDWDEMVTSSEVAVSDPVRDAIIESEHGPRILYLMASDPAIADKLSGMTILGQLREIGKMEAKLEAGDLIDRALHTERPEAKAETKADPVSRPRPPAPITPAKGTKTADDPTKTSGEFTGTYQEWRAARQRSSH